METVLPAELSTRYTLDSKKGEGRNGIVYKVVNIVNNRSYALKTIKSDAVEKEKAAHDIRKEVEFLIKCDHRLLPRVYEYSIGEQEKMPWFVSSFHPGVTFEDFINQKKRMHLSDSLITMLSLADVLEYIHENRGVHCDLHPRNILISENVFRYGIMLIDFGSGHVWSGSSPFTRESGDFRYKPAELQPEHRLLVPRSGRVEAWQSEDFNAVGHLLGKMGNVFMSYGTEVQSKEYFDLCCDLRNSEINDWGQVKSRLYQVFQPYTAIESNADVLGHGENSSRSLCLPVTGHLRINNAFNQIVESNEFQRLQQIGASGFVGGFLIDRKPG